MGESSSSHSTNQQEPGAPTACQLSSRLICWLPLKCWFLAQIRPPRPCFPIGKGNSNLPEEKGLNPVIHARVAPLRKSCSICPSQHLVQCLDPGPGRLPSHAVWGDLRMRGTCHAYTGEQSRFRGKWRPRPYCVAMRASEGPVLGPLCLGFYKLLLRLVVI